MQPPVIVLALLATCLLYLYLRSQGWRLGVVFNIGIFLVLSGGVHAVISQYSHDPSRDWFGTALDLFVGSTLVVLGAWSTLKQPEARTKLLPIIIVVLFT